MRPPLRREDVRKGKAVDLHPVAGASSATTAAGAAVVGRVGDHVNER